MTLPAPMPTTGRPRLSVVTRPHPVSTHVRIDTKLASATREVLIINDLSSALGDPIAMFRQIDRENIRRGVRYRALFPDRARLNPATAKRLSCLALAGAEVRTMPDVPVDALVIDGQVAVLPADPADDQAAGVAMFRLPSVVGTICELFEQVWPAAVPLSTGDNQHGAELTAREKELLGLLSAGCTDESAGAQLGISVRTVRRMVSGIMSRLGARSRFQAGVKAADRGWLVERAG